MHNLFGKNGHAPTVTPLESRLTYYKKKKLLSTLRKIEDVKEHQNFVVKNFWRLVAVGVILSLAIPAQGLGDIELKGPSILKMMDAEYWQVAVVFAILYCVCFTIFHFGWKLQDYLYLKELNETRDQLMQELGIVMNTPPTP